MSNPQPPQPAPRPPPSFVLSSHAVLAISARGLDLAWIESCMASPDRRELDRVDPTLRHVLKRIDAAEGRVLRVVYNPTPTPLGPPLIVTAFLDRSMKGKL